MKKILFLLVFVPSTLFSQGAYFNFSIGPDVQVKKVVNSYSKTRFRTNFEIGSKNFAFAFQPAFGNDSVSLFLAPKFMIPLQIGSNPLFIIPDFTPGFDFGFSNGDVGFAIDIKFYLRAFYEFKPGMAITFTPFGLSLRPVNVWFGSRPNQTQLSVVYELAFGYAYFF
jgi:hypothetical protein